MRQSVSGDWEPDPNATPQRIDWAAFVTEALAGAAANIGGAEAILAGRPGSWESAKVRGTLYSTVGVDDECVWEHRTEPIAITINVANILDDTGAAQREYDEAEAEIERRREALGLPIIDWAPDAPDAAERLAAQPTAEQDAADDHLLALLDDLDARRRREWSAYGEALKAAVEQRVRAIEGVEMRVSITVELQPHAQTIRG